MEEFGLETPDWMDDLIKEGEFYGNVSAERARSIEADLLLTYVENDDDMQKIVDDRLLGRIPAVASGNYLGEADKELGTAVTNPTPLSIPVIVRDFLPKVAGAVDGG